ncbi:MAG: hypothetical protein WCR37_05335, partial [Candidatus Methanomethylophilaceae archaeon]
MNREYSIPLGTKRHIMLIMFCGKTDDGLFEMPVIKEEDGSIALRRKQHKASFWYFIRPLGPG